MLTWASAGNTTKMVVSGKFGIEFTGDATKDTLVIPRILLKVVALWPDTLSIRTILYPIIMYVLFLLMETSLLVFLVLNIRDINKMAMTVSSISIILQVLFKIAIIFFYSGKLKQMILVLNRYFWASNLMDLELERSLKYNAKIVATAMLFIYITGVVFVVSFFAMPAITGKRELPIVASYPFDWNKSPIYELLYFLQSYGYTVIALNAVLGHDSMFFMIVTNCVAQFELLKSVLSKIGSPEIEDINKKLDQYYDADEDDKSFSGNTKLLYRCIEHHRKLIRMCNDLERIYTIGIAMQFLESLLAICVSSYLITAMNLDPSQLPALLSYVVGHLSQLFFYCTAGNALTDQANSLSTSLFHSQWYESHVTRDVKKALPIVIQRSQKCQKITALGIADLNYTAFLKVLQMSFSFYTLLSKMTEKK